MAAQLFAMRHFRTKIEAYERGVARQLLSSLTVAMRDKQSFDTGATPDAQGFKFRNNKKKEVGMLVLSRKSGERIHIGDNIIVEVRRLAGNRVSLAIEAPRSVRVLRGELWQSATDFDEVPDAPDAPSSTEPVDNPANQETFIIPPGTFEPGKGISDSHVFG